ncbi:FadR/GntR family transcriptional regulator [Rhodococcus sp. NPDC058505]|uniref:FadR/GntR family transcriptional regulator n=1 Tax=unclassified Rhodococcus (in: high G+C Gram-positive bacteria) TaxID=192944 RepID=UPI00364CA9E5
MSSRSDRPQKTAMIIARRIVAEIDRRGLRPGDRLPSERLMLDEYQVGRGTLREALRYLELSGAISLKPGPGGGPTVEKPDASHLMNSLGLVLQFEGAPFSTIVEARVGLEPLMARLAADRSSDEQRALLAESVAKMGENLKDLDVFLETNKTFHDVIAWASGNALFGFLIDAVDGIFEGVALGVEYPAHRRAKVHQAHAEILAAIDAGDAVAAEDAMRTHVLELTGYLRKKFPAAMAKPITWDAMQ